MEEKYSKTYVDVITVMRKDGYVLPKIVIWKNGAKIPIDRVLHIELASSTKVGGRGTRYTVKIGSFTRYLFREEDKWFVETEKTQ